MTFPTSLGHELGPGIQLDLLPTLAGVSVRAFWNESMPEGVARDRVACSFPTAASRPPSPYSPNAAVSGLHLKLALVCRRPRAAHHGDTG